MAEPIRQKFVTQCHLDECLSRFQAAAGRFPDIIKLPTSAWERAGKPGKVQGIPVEPIPGRMIVLEAS